MNLKDTLPVKKLPFLPYIYISLGTSVFLVLFVILVQRFLPPQVPLLYGSVVSEKQLVGSLGLIIPSLVSIVITFANIGLSFFTKDVFLKKALILTTFLVCIFSTVTTLKIIFLVGSFK